MITTWKNLNNLDTLDQIDQDSKTKSVVLFKHSTRCGISLHAESKLESAWDLIEKDLDFYYLDLLNHRNISTEIATRYNVVHQSPQIIVIRNGKAVFDISHNGIDLATLKMHI